jgi:RHS repeat-associated protein
MARITTHRGTPVTRAQRLPFRAAATLSILTQTLFGVPIAVASPQRPAPSRPAKVTVNRTVPKVTPPPRGLELSEHPTDAEIFRARVFTDPLVAMGEPTTPGENAALARAIRSYAAGGGGDRTAPLEAYLIDSRGTAWRASLQLALGKTYLRAGRFSRAMRALADAWGVAKDETEPKAKAIADTAVAELARLYGRLSHVTELQELLGEIEGRPITGTAAQMLQQSRETLAVMESDTAISFRCGPIALDRLLALGTPDYRTPPRLAQYGASALGTTLGELAALADELGLELQMAKRVDLSGGVLVPSVVHWNVGHFAAIVARRADGRFLVKDPVFGGEMWVTREAIDEELSGFALVPQGDLPWGWRRATQRESEHVWGRGNVTSKDEQRTRRNDRRDGGDECDCSDGMARYSVHSLLVSLNVVDTPLRYTPPVGPSVAFTVRYIHRDAFQPQPELFTYWNLGDRWTTDWLAYITDDPNDGTQPVDVYLRGGGQESYAEYDAQTASYAPHKDSRAVVVRTAASPIRYERQLPDGSYEVYEDTPGAVGTTRNVFLSQIVDPTGHALTLTYDYDGGNVRLAAVQDAVDQVTDLHYEDPTDPLKLTGITDPFGREAHFAYDSEARLREITDIIDLQSTFEYSGDFISTLTTPYGETQFEMGGDGLDQWIETTDVLGGKERIEFRANTSGLPSEATPTGNWASGWLNYRNTFYWDKKAWDEGVFGDYSKATIIHWLHASRWLASGTAESVKKPLENRVWYHYPGQAEAGGAQYEGSSSQPTTVARVLDDGTTQAHEYEYNQRGMKIREVDPLGRETIYVYGTDNVPDADPVNGSGLDLLEVRQTNPDSALGYDVQATYIYNPNHQVLTATDAAGEPTTYTYTPTGQIETVTDALNETTTYTYYTDGQPKGQLETVSGPLPGTTTTYEYEYDEHPYRRLWRVTDPEGYQTTTEYDTFDRPRKVTYPDETYEETVYERLDAVAHRDRLGRWTRTFYDALRRPVAIRDAAGRTVQQQFCNCGGSVEKLVDANGNETFWERDLQGRIIQEIRANEATYLYAYESTTSRLKSVTDPKENVKTHTYNLDNTLATITYTEAAGTAPTPDVGFTYDPVYNRVETMTDGTGTTTYFYYPITDPPTLGAGRLQSIDGPLTDDTIEYQYDELGRVVQREIGSPTNVQTQHYDTLGRLEILTNPLGPFTYTYDGVTGRPESLTYPNGQSTTYDYYDNLGDHRLHEIHNKRPGGATLSRFEYTYDAVGNILTWLQQADSNQPNMYQFGYDPADQLTAAILWTTDPVPQVLKRYYYAYDPAGNRTAEQVDDAVTGATYNNMNQLTSQQAGGALVFKGTVSEPATVTVGGKPATVTVDNRFEGQADVPEGTGQVQVTATDPSGNVRTSTYEVSQAGTPKSFTYDLNGNMTSDGTRTYEWDAENRLVAVKEGPTTIASYTYNHGGIRTSKTTAAGTTTYILEDESVVEERDGSGVTKHFHGPGVDNVLATQDPGGVITFLTRDHLRSVREHVDSAGATVTLRRDYDPWGSLSSAVGFSGWAFTGRETDGDVALQYHRARYYTPALGRFLSEDPLRLKGGLNFYAYVGNAPTVKTDPLGLFRIGNDEVCWSYVFRRSTPMGDPLPDANASVCCRDGAYVPCFNFKYYSTASEAAKKCTREHEAVHIDDYRRYGCTSCCEDECTLAKCPAFSYKSGDECAAWARGLLCLNESGGSASEIDEARRGVWLKCFNEKPRW